MFLVDGEKISSNELLNYLRIIWITPIMEKIMLQSNTEKSLFLAETLNNSLESVRECTICRMYSEEELCEICKDNKRDQNTLCIVETPADLLALENTMQFNGRYFVLMGHLSPIDGIGPEELKINQLEELFKRNPINEIIIATSPTVDGEATSAYIASVAQNFNIKATRIAYGVPFGGEIEYVDSNTLVQAILNRNTIGNQK